MTSYLDGMLRYFDFSGRSTRTQYWLFWLISLVVGLAAVFADYFVFGIHPQRNYYGPLALMVGIAHIIPSISVTVRRLHDTGRSGWWYFLPFLPIIGSIIHFVMMCWAGDRWDNRFGPAGDAYSFRQSVQPRATATTIPRQVRMGSGSARPAHIAPTGEIQRFI